MSAEWVVAIGTIGTFVVIAASATAALVQMRHMRSANQISLFTWYNAELDSPQAIGPIAYFTRKQRGQPAIWENFEYLAVPAENFLKRYPAGIYPKTLRRLPVDDSLSLQYEATTIGTRMAGTEHRV